MSEAAGKLLTQSRGAIRALLKDAPNLSGYLPQELAHGSVNKYVYQLEDFVSGESGYVKLNKDVRLSTLLDGVGRFILSLRENADKKITITRELYEQEVGWTFSALSDKFPQKRDDIAKIQERTANAFIGSDLQLGWGHGDLNPGNVIFKDDPTELAGVIDWDNANSRALPLQDFIHFVVSGHRYAQGNGVGPAVVSMLKDSLMTAEQQELFDSHVSNNEVEDELVKPLILFYWVRHIAWHCEYRNTWKKNDWVETNFFNPLDRITKDL